MIDDFDDLDLLEEESRPAPQRPWYLLTGLVLGLALGLIFAWALSPVRYTDTGPAALRGEFKDEYRLLIALAYQANDNPARALQRLDLLADANPKQQLAAQSQQLNLDGRIDDSRALAALEEMIAAEPEPAVTGSLPAAVGAAASPTAPTAPAATIETLPQASPTATLTAAATASEPTASPAPTTTSPPQPDLTPLAAQTARPSLPASFRLLSQQQVCDPALPERLLQVEVFDSAGRPLAGVGVTVRWEGGAETFRTGLYPEISAGYADFAMQPGVAYNLSAGEGGEVVSGLSAPACEETGRPAFQGGWRVQFGQ